MNIASKLAARLANDDIQTLFVERLLEPVMQGGKYGDLLKLWELVTALPNTDGDGRPFEKFSDADLRGLLREISGRDFPDGIGGRPGGDEVPEAGRGAAFRL